MPKARKGSSMDDVPVNSAGKRKRAGDVVDLLELPKNKYKRVRLFGPAFAYGGFWVTTKKRDGSKATFYTASTSFDPETGRMDTTIEDPWRDHPGKEVRPSTYYYIGAIDRQIQKSKPEDPELPTKEEKAAGFKLKSTETWTAKRALKAPTSLMRELKGLKELNVHEDADGNSVAYGIADDLYGCDVMIKYMPDNPPASQYSVQLKEVSPLTKAEKRMLGFDLSDLEDIPTVAEQKKEYKSWAERMGLSTASDDDEDEDKPKKGKKRVLDDEDDDEDDDPKPKKKPAKRVVDEDDDDDDDDPPVKKPAKKTAKKVVDDDEDEDDEDEDDPPKKKPVKKTTKRVVDEDEDEEDDDDPPPKKSSRKGPPKISDDDLDEDDEDDDPPKKSKKKVVDEDVDEDDPPPKKKPVKRVVDEDDEDDDDEPPKKPAKKTAKRVVDEDDDEDDDEEDDEEDDDDPPPKKSKTASKKSKQVFDDDDD